MARMATEEEPIVTTPVYVFAGGPRPGGHVFLTDKQVLIAITDQPFGSEASPFVIETSIAAITALVITEDPTGADPTVAPGGLLVILNPDSAGNEASNVLDLYPSPISQRFLRELRDRWTNLG